MSTDARAEYAIAAASRGEFDRARSAVIDLVAEDWHNAAAHQTWAQVLLEEGKATDAVAAYRTAVSLDPQRAELHFELAQALLIEAEKNPFVPLSNWLDTRDAVEAGLKMWPTHELGLELQRKVEDQRVRALL